MVETLPGSGVFRCDCGYVGLPTRGECPVCVIAAETDHVWSVTRAAVVNDRDRYVKQRVAETIGRNDPCDCGSGRKAKKCCHG